MSRNVHILTDPDTMSVAAARHWMALANEAIDARGAFHVALSGGGTPRRMYEILGRAAGSRQVPWENVHVYFSDERCVPPDHPDSNYRMAREALLDKIHVPAEQVFRMDCGPDPQTAAARYAQTLARIPAAHDGIPVLDLVLLGLGRDGHIASLFPGSEMLEERDKTVAAVHAAPLSSWRLTFTLPVIEAAREVFFLVAGEEKRQVVAQTLRGGTARLPADRLQAMGDVHWYLDAAAARDWLAAS